MAQIRPAATEGESSHAWSVGASQGEHAVKLDSLRDGLTRLVSCQPLENTPQSGRLSSMASRSSHRVPGSMQMCH